MRPWAVAGLAFAASAMAAAPSLELVDTFHMPGVKGRIDHLAVDVEGHRLFVAALGNDTVEVLDMERRARRTVHGLGEPQGVAYVAHSRRLVIANGGADRVDIVDAATLAAVKRIPNLDDADNVRYDPAARQVLVGYGKGALRILDPSGGESAGDIFLPGHPESFQLERDGVRAFVNVPSAHGVVVVDRTKRTVLARWDTGDASANFPMALDEAGRRLFVGARSPAALLVYDTGTGKIAATVPIGKDTDDVFFDARRERVYAICGEGRIDVIRRESADRYAVEESIPTARGARTGLFVPEEGRIYVAAPATGASPARVLVYRLR